MDYKNFIEEIEEGSIYEDIKIKNKKYKLIILNSKGLFIFLQLKKEREYKYIKATIAELHSILTFNPRFIYTFFTYQDKDYFYDYYKNDLKEIDSIEDKFYEINDNTFPVLTEDSEDETRMSVKGYENLLDSFYFKKEDVYEDEYGNEYKIMQDGSEILISELDADNHFKWTLFGGLFGIHKFREGNIFTGLFYLFTFGGFGVGYFFDLLFMIIGIYKYKNKIQYDDGSCYKGITLLGAVSDKKKAVLCLLGALVAAVLYSFLYMFLMEFLFDIVEMFFMSVLEESVSSINASIDISTTL